jgi:multiple sugar transport system permease protein
MVQLVRMSVSSVDATNLGDVWKFTGFANLLADISGGNFTQALGRTVVFAALVTVIGIVGGLAAAIALRKSRRGSGVLLALMVFVWALPPVINGSTWKFLFDNTGLFNVVLHQMGLGQIGFLYDQHLALLSVALVNAWTIVPFNALVYRAAIMSVPVELFEAAELDGAGPLKQITNVIIPAIRSTTLVLLILTIVYGFRSFDFVYVMTSGGPGTVTTTLPYLGYVQAFTEFNYGQGAATAVTTVVLVVVFALFYARSVSKEEVGE